MTASSEQSAETGGAGGQLAWRVWPAAQRPALSLIVAVFCIIVSGLAMWSLGSGWYAFISLAVLTGALATYYFPTQYLLDEGGVHTRSAVAHRDRPWTALRACFDQGDRLLLSPVSRETGWLVRQRGIIVLLADNKQQVMAFVDGHLSAPANCVASDKQV